MLVSWWSVNFVSVVVGVLVALWWCVRSVLTVSGDFGSFFGVLAVFRWCLGGIDGMVFSCIFSPKLVHLSTQKFASKKTRNFAIGVVGWVNLLSVLCGFRCEDFP